jgi:predicted aspartyl protease
MSNKIVAQAFTIRYDGLANVLITDCAISLPTTLEDNSIQNFIDCKGLWDTGATGSVISKNIADKLGLKPTGVQKVNHANGSSLKNTYLINIYLPNKVRVVSVKVTEGIFIDFDILIGMDIINHGDFSISNKDGKTIFSFKTPSTKMIDFVKEIDRNKPITNSSYNNRGSKKKSKKKR